jgi:hypothetical protein
LTTHMYGVVGKERRAHTPQYCMTRRVYVWLHIRASFFDTSFFNL